MQYTPKSEKQIIEENLWPVGIYGFEINESVEKQSKTSGKDMFALKITLSNDEGRTKIIDDYLLEAIAYKLRHCAVACGLENEYDTVSLKDYMFTGKTGLLKLGIQKNKTGQYPDKNVISDYITEKDAPPASPRTPKVLADTKDDFDDEIPF